MSRSGSLSGSNAGRQRVAGRPHDQVDRAAQVVAERLRAPARGPRRGPCRSSVCSISATCPASRPCVAPAPPGRRRCCSASASWAWPSRWVSTPAPSRPAVRKVSGEPALVIQTGSSGWTGGGKIRTACWSPPRRRRTRPPRPATAAGPCRSSSTITLLRSGVVLRPQHEVDGVPAGGERHARPGRRRGCRRPTTPRRSATGWCSGATTLPARIADPRGHGGERGAGDRRVRVQAAERVEVPLRRPHRREAVGVGEPCAVQQQVGSRRRRRARRRRRRTG